MITTRMASGILNRKEKVKRLWSKIKYMEIWELLKESFLRGKLSSEMPQLFTLLITVPLMKTGPKRSLTAETGSRQLCLDSSVEAAELIAQTVRGADPKHRMRQSPSQSYSSEKPYSWQVHFVSAYQQCAMLSKRLKKTVACCYETYRMRREGKVESPLHFF